MSADVRDILDLDQPTVEITKESLLNNRRKNYESKVKAVKRPEGMHREVFALLYNDNKDAPPLLPTDTGAGYIQVKARLGMKKVRKWEWAPFTNPARTDQAVFHHWRRTTDEPKEYPFAKFNKKLNIPNYTTNEYTMHLKSNTAKWTKPQTDHLFDLAKRFDLRFVVMADRWDRANYGTKTVEDLKERYYEVLNVLNKIKNAAAAAAAAAATAASATNTATTNSPTTPGTTTNAVGTSAAVGGGASSTIAGSPLLNNNTNTTNSNSGNGGVTTAAATVAVTPADKKMYVFDAEHERKRKEQLKKLFDRSPKQIEEEQMLLNELKKIEARKKERDRKTQDLQKLISQADQQGDQAQTPASARKHDKKLNKKKIQPNVRPSRVDSVVNAVESAGIKFNELRGTGVSLRSQKMKLPANVGQKKAKALEQALIEFKVDHAPPPTDEICNAFNEIRSDMVLLCELRTALSTCNFELESLKHQYEALCPGKTLNIPASLATPVEDQKPDIDIGSHSTVPT